MSLTTFLMICADLHGAGASVRPQMYSMRSFVISTL